MRTREVAKLLNVTTTTIRNISDKGELPCTRYGEYRDYRIEDIREYYLNKVTNRLHDITFRRHILESSVPNSDFFDDYCQLAQKEIICDVIKIAGRNSGYFKKLVGLFDLDEADRVECDLLVEEIEALMGEIRRFGNKTPPSIKMGKINNALDKVYQLFEVLSPDFKFDRIYTAEPVITLEKITA